MAVREVKIRRLVRIGLTLSAVSSVTALASMAMIWHEWVPDDKVIYAGTVYKPAILIVLAVAILSGFPGFLLSLEGAAELKGGWRKVSWLGFFLGAIGTLAGLGLGLWFKFYNL